MGNGARLFCMDCKDEEEIGRAYRFNSEAMNKKLNPDTYEQLQLAVKRFEMSLQKIEFFGEKHETWAYEIELDFLEQHKGHNVWIVDDYFEEKKKEGAD